MGRGIGKEDYDVMLGRLLHARMTNIGWEASKVSSWCWRWIFFGLDGC